MIEKFYYKLKLDMVFNRLASSITRATWKDLHIMSARQTVDYILENNCSMARFGDGELQVLAYGCSLNFQRADKELQKRLLQVMNNSNPNLLLCLPNRLNAIKEEERLQLSEYWQESLKQHLYAWTKNISKARVYGDTNLTRLTETATKDDTLELINYIKSIWERRNVIMIEGAKTRFGVGNNLFDNTLSVHRILGPATSAFDYYSELLESSINLANTLENPLVLIALGPTATVLASDLSDHGIQALDLGHLDICYEHLLNGNNGAVVGKYTNEAVGGDIVADCEDEDYKSQIVLSIGH